MYQSFSGFRQPNNFLKIFPVPKSFVFDMAGLEIGYGVVRLIKLKATSIGLVPDYYSEFNIDTVCLESDDFKIEACQSLISKLSSLKEKSGISFVKLSIPESKCYIYTTNVVIEDDQSLDDAVSFTLENNVPLSAEEVQYDYEIVSQNIENKTALVSVTVIPISIIRSYVEVAQRAGFTPVLIQTDGHAIFSSVVSKRNHKSCLVINWTEQSIILTIGSNGVVQFTANIEAPVKIKEFSDSDLRAKNLRKEISKNLLYWYSNHARNSGQIEEIILVGLSRDLEDFGEYLRHHLGNIDVKIGQVWQNCFSFEDYIPEISRENSLRYGVAVGLALSS